MKNQATYKGFEMLNDALRYLWATFPPKAFPNEHPDFAAAVQTIESARYACMVELEPWKYRPRS